MSRLKAFRQRSILLAAPRRNSWAHLCKVISPKLEHSPIELNRKGWRGIPKVLQIGESLLIDSEEIEDAEALFARLA